MIKVYEALRMNAARLFTTFMGVKIELNFKNGNLLRGVNANLVTSDRFVQDAIEHDNRFGVTIRLKSSYAETQEDKETLAEGKAGNKSTKLSASQKERIAKNAVKAVDTVKTMNDVIDYFTSLGETVESEEQIEELKEKYKVKFPNLK